MGLIKSIVEKFKIKELVALLFIAALVITVLPKEIAVSRIVRLIYKNSST